MSFDVRESIKAQEEFCSRNGAPLFAPAWGFCYRCGEQIYKEKKQTGWNGREYTTGISTEEAGKRLITGCPHCKKSFCD